MSRGRLYGGEGAEPESPIAASSTDAKRAAIKLNARALARYLEARADDAWAGKLSGTWSAGRKVRTTTAPFSGCAPRYACGFACWRAIRRSESLMSTPNPGAARSLLRGSRPSRAGC